MKPCLIIQAGLFCGVKDRYLPSTAKMEQVGKKHLLRTLLRIVFIKIELAKSWQTKC